MPRHFRSPLPYSRLLECKTELLSMRESKAETKPPEKHEPLLNLLKKITKVLKSLKSDNPRCATFEIACYFQLADTYFEIALQAKQASNTKIQSSAYREAGVCLSRAEGIILREQASEGRVDRKLVATLNAQNLSDPKEARRLLRGALESDVLSATEGEPTHRIVK